jgi:hypothetical protein
VHLCEMAVLAAGLLMEAEQSSAVPASLAWQNGLATCCEMLHACPGCCSGVCALLAHADVVLAEWLILYGSRGMRGLCIAAAVQCDGVVDCGRQVLIVG